MFLLGLFLLGNAIVIAFICREIALGNTTLLVSHWKIQLCCCILSCYAAAVVSAGISVNLTIALTPAVFLLCFMVITVVASTYGRAASSDNPPTKYQFVGMPLSPFCETVRWTLDLLDVHYNERSEVGLLSMLLRSRRLPWLVDSSSCSLIGNSDEIVRYLGAAEATTLSVTQHAHMREFFQRTPISSEWEVKLNHFGHVVQSWCLHSYLAPTAPAKYSLLAWGAYESRVPFYQRWLLWLLHPMLKYIMRAVLQLDDDQVHVRRRCVIEEVLDAADAALTCSSSFKEQPFLLGDRLSYVDVTFAACAAQLISLRLVYRKNAPYANGVFTSFARGAQWEDWPAALVEMEDSIMRRPCGRYLVRMYEEQRNHTAPASVEEDNE